MRILKKNGTSVKLPFHTKTQVLTENERVLIICFDNIVLSAGEVMEVINSFGVLWGCCFFKYFQVHVLTCISFCQIWKIGIDSKFISAILYNSQLNSRSIISLYELNKHKKRKKKPQTTLESRLGVGVFFQGIISQGRQSIVEFVHLFVQVSQCGFCAYISRCFCVKVNIINKSQKIF